MQVILFSLLICCCNLINLYGQNSPKPIQIGNQVWMDKNLSVKHFSNGDEIPFAKSREEWQKAGEDCTPAWSYYENSSAFAEKVGILYNWYAVTDLRGLAPKGWKIPETRDFEELISFLGGKFIAGKKLKSRQDWFRNGHGDNTTGFNAIAGGNRDMEGNYYYIVRVGNWWTKNEYDPNNGVYYYLEYKNDSFLNYGAGKSMGMSVRCIR